MSIYFKMDGVEGDATDSSFVDQVPIDTCSFGVNRPVEMVTGQGKNRSSSKPNFDQIHMGKLLDGGSLGLFQATIQGKEGNDALISFTRSAEDETITYLTIELKNCVPSDYDISAQGDELPAESISLSYTSINYNWLGSAVDGAAGSPASYGFDINEAKKI